MCAHGCGRNSDERILGPEKVLWYSAISNVLCFGKVDK